MNWEYIALGVVDVGGILLLMEIIDQCRKYAPKPGKNKHPFDKSGKRRNFSKKLSRR